MKKIENIINWTTYKQYSVLEDFYKVPLPEEEPRWFSKIQKIALRTIWSHMLNKHIFPYNESIFSRLKDEYVDIVEAAICSQIDYIYKNITHSLNLIDENRSVGINRYYQGPIDYTVLKELVFGLEPLTTYIGLSSIGWLYNGVGYRLKFDMYYNKEDNNND